MASLIEEQVRGDAEVVYDVQELLYRWVRFPGDDVLDVVLVVAEIATHFGFRYTFFHSQLSNAFPYKVKLHNVTPA